MANEQPAMTTDGRRPSWMFKQMDRLVAANEAVPDLAYLHRILALCSLPRTNPGNTKEFKRVNGPITLGMVAGLDNKLPYGNIPRLLMVWMCSEATQKQSRELFLGDSLSAFLEKVGIPKGGGPRTRLREQMNRFYSTLHVSLIYREQARQGDCERADSPISTEFWWNERQVPTSGRCGRARSC